MFSVDVLTKLIKMCGFLNCYATTLIFTSTNVFLFGFNHSYLGFLVVCPGLNVWHVCITSYSAAIHMHKITHCYPTMLAQKKGKKKFFFLCNIQIYPLTTLVKCSYCFIQIYPKNNSCTARAPGCRTSQQISCVLHSESCNCTCITLSSNWLVYNFPTVDLTLTFNFL